jgi:thioredoxin-related protein
MISCSAQVKTRDVPPDASEHVDASHDSIGWYTSIAGAFRKGIEVDKPVMVYFYSKSCGWCSEMEKNTFTHPTVIKSINDNFVPVYVDVESSKEVAQFELKVVPTVMFIDVVDGRTIGVSRGYRTPADMIEIFGIVNDVINSLE